MGLGHTAILQILVDSILGRVLLLFLRLKRVAEILSAIKSHCYLRFPLISICVFL